MYRIHFLDKHPAPACSAQQLHFRFGGSRPRLLVTEICRYRGGHGDLKGGGVVETLTSDTAPASAAGCEMSNQPWSLRPQSYQRKYEVAAAEEVRRCAQIKGGTVAPRAVSS